MKHTIKLGDRFRLGAWVWTVKHMYPETVQFCAATDRRFGGTRLIYIFIEDADSLDWIKPEVMFTAEQVEAIKEAYMVCHRVTVCQADGRFIPEQDVFLDWLDSHTEKE